LGDWENKRIDWVYVETGPGTRSRLIRKKFPHRGRSEISFLRRLREPSFSDSHSLHKNSPSDIAVFNIPLLVKTTIIQPKPTGAERICLSQNISQYLMLRQFSCLIRSACRACSDVLFTLVPVRSTAKTEQIADKQPHSRSINLSGMKFTRHRENRRRNKLPLSLTKAKKFPVRGHRKSGIPITAAQEPLSKRRLEKNGIGIWVLKQNDTRHSDSTRMRITDSFSTAD
jgi:hypothetical protein